MNVASTSTPSDHVRVLFVDDEPRILDGIVRTLRPQRARLDVMTANGGEAGLDLLARSSVDMVISDMRMPSMDGAAFLAAVRERHPQVLRIILSGQGDKDTIVSATRVAHQFLSKPSDLQVLCATMDQFRWYRGLVQDPQVRVHLASLSGLPSAPGTRDVLQQMLAAEATPMSVSEVIAADPGLAAKVLQVTSTSFFGTPQGIITPGEAARRLGVDILRALLHAGAFSGPSTAGDSWMAQVAVARRAAHLARQCALIADAPLAPIVETAGLLHVCGCMAMSGCVPEAASRPDAGNDGRDVAGAFLLGLWGLPTHVVEAVARHREPSRRPGSHDRPVAIVHAASALAASGPHAVIDEAFVTQAGFGRCLPQWRGLATQLP